MSWIKDLLKSVTTGEGLATKLIDTVSGYIPSKEDKARLEIEIRKIAHAQELEIQRAELEADKELNNRIKDLEGTANDLMQAGYAGRIVLFLRGAQRPLWGWSVMLMDIRVYLGSTTLGDEEMKLLYALNLLVGGFLFGERAIKNVMPFFKDMIANRK